MTTTTKTYSGGISVPVPHVLYNISTSVVLLALLLVVSSASSLLAVDRYTKSQPQPPPSGAPPPPPPTLPQEDSSAAVPTLLTKAVLLPPSASVVVTGSMDGSDALNDTRVEGKAIADKDLVLAPDDLGQRQEKYTGDENPTRLADFRRMLQMLTLPTIKLIFDLF